ncbi:MAG TPA: hypothetical protein VN026_10145, partial [Bacteroidia bacterium]|nr:hypothetical protein [Bacteroidia bacterium]
VIYYLTVVIILISCNNPEKKLEMIGMQETHDGTFINGDWTYRSLLNNPIDTIPFNNLEFATAIMRLKQNGRDSIAGELNMGSSGKLVMSGKINYCNGDIVNFEMQGDGIKGTSTQGWIYNYKCFVVQKWKQGVGQVDAFVGSVVRTVDHGQAKAGKVASFYSVKRN